VESPQPEWSGLRLTLPLVQYRRAVVNANFTKLTERSTYLHVMCAVPRNSSLTRNERAILTRSDPVDNFVLERSFVGENRDLDRILRRLKLHAEGRQFGDQNP